MGDVYQIIAHSVNIRSINNTSPSETLHVRMRRCSGPVRFIALTAGWCLPTLKHHQALSGVGGIQEAMVGGDGMKGVTEKRHDTSDECDRKSFAFGRKSIASTPSYCLKKEGMRRKKGDQAGYTWAKIIQSCPAQIFLAPAILFYCGCWLPNIVWAFS